MRPPLRRITAIAAIVGAGVSTFAYIATSRAVDGHESNLLEAHSAAAATLLAAVLQQEEQALSDLAQKLEPSAGAATSPGAASPAQAGVAGAAVLRKDAQGGLTVEARTGVLQAAVPDPGLPYHPAWASTLKDSLTFTGFVGQGTRRALGITLGFPDGEVLYGELPLAATAQPAGKTAKAPATPTPFDGLNFALYLGTAETPAALVAANTKQLPLSGTRATVKLTGSAIAPPPVISAAPGSITASPHQLVMVVTPQGLLGGALDAVLPWSVLGGSLLVTLLMAGFLEVTARRRDQAVALAAALRESNGNFRQLFADNPQPMWVYDLETLRILDVNEMAITKYGYSRDEFMGMRITDIRPAEDLDKLAASLIARGRSPVDASGPWRHRLRDGRLIDVTVSSHVQDWGGREAALVSVRDVTVERALEEQLRHQALHDPLTGAGNREMLMTHLAESLEAAASSCALLLVDVAGMKAVNDSLGRDGADELLVAVCERLIIAAGGTAHVARIGGDVFAAATRLGTAGEDDPTAAAESWAGRALASLRDAFSVRGQHVSISAYAGLALGDTGVDERELMRRADIALELAKETRASHGEHVELFDVEHDQVRAERRLLAADLRRAIDADELRLVYQPQLDLRTGTVAGVEALIRWEHPQRGLLMPMIFLPIAEASGLTAAIDSWVISTACAQARAWRDQGLPELTMAVNICGHDVETGPVLVEHVRNELRRHRLPAHLLEIELTESVALRDHEEAETVLADLRALGVRIAIDDFGTGYSTLDRIRDLPIDRVKIDRTFVRRAGGDGAPLLRAMLAMAHSLGLDAVAEGVETTQDLDLLRRWDCDVMQGYLVSKPVAPDQIPALLRIAVLEPDAEVRGGRRRVSVSL